MRMSYPAASTRTLLEQARKGSSYIELHGKRDSGICHYAGRADPVTLQQKNDPLEPYYGYILAGISSSAFGSLVYTVFRQLRGTQHAIQFNDFLHAPISDTFRDPKVAAYIMAGKAFGVASLLCLTGTAALYFGVSVALGVKQPSQLPNKLASLLNSPKAKSSVNESNDERYLDAEARELLQQIQKQFERTELGQASSDGGSALSNNMRTAFRKSVFGAS